MTRSAHFLFLAAAGLTLSAAALAQVEPAAAPVDPAAPGKLPLWEIGMVGGAVSTPAYPAATERSNRALVLPYLIYRGEVLRADAGGIGARLFHNDALELDVGFAASLPAKSDDVAVRRGMPDLGTLIEFGPQLKITLDQPSPSSRIRLELPLRAVIEARAGLRTQGIAFEPRLVFEERDFYQGWSLGASLSTVFGNLRLNQYFYEVAPQFATATRPRYQAEAGRMLTRLGLSTAHELNPDWRVFGFARYDLYAGAASNDSPLFRKTSGVSVGLGFAWTWQRSDARAK